MTNNAGHEGSKPPCLREDALAVLTRLREAGHVAYFAGGCVRDELLGLTPKDYDVATDAPPDRVRKLFMNTQAVGAAFGVILVRHQNSVIEVATFRTDGKYVDGRRPEGVTFTTAEEDAKRRDFTINGLFLDPVENRVIDYVGGQEDLRGRVLRAIGDANHRFEEDHLRLLRAVRFAARFGLRIHERTAEAIAEHADQLKRISPERIADELRLMLTGETRGDAYVLLRQFRLREVILRFLPERSPRRVGDPPSLFLALGPPLHRGPVSFGLALAALVLEYRSFHRLDDEVLPLLTSAEVKRSSNAMRQALKISNDEHAAMAGALSFGHLIGEAEPGVAAIKRFLAAPYSSDARVLMAALAKCGLHQERIVHLSNRFDEFDGTDFAPPPLVTGDDLTDAGLTPGPRFKVALDQTYDAQLEGRVTTRRQAVEMAIGIAKGETV